MPRIEICAFKLFNIFAIEMKILFDLYLINHVTLSLLSMFYERSQKNIINE